MRNDENPRNVVMRMRLQFNRINKLTTKAEDKISESALKRDVLTKLPKSIKPGILPAYHSVVKEELKDLSKVTITEMGNILYLHWTQLYPNKVDIENKADGETGLASFQPKGPCKRCGNWHPPRQCPEWKPPTGNRDK